MYIWQPDFSTVNENVKKIDNNAVRFYEYKSKSLEYNLKSLEYNYNIYL